MLKTSLTLKAPIFIPLPTQLQIKYTPRKCTYSKRQLFCDCETGTQFLTSSFPLQGGQKRVNNSVMGNQCAGAGGLSNHSTKAPTTAERSKGPGEWGGIGTTSIGLDQGAYGRRGISLKSCNI